MISSVLATPLSICSPNITFDELVNLSWSSCAAEPACYELYNAGLGTTDTHARFAYTVLLHKEGNSEEYQAVLAYGCHDPVWGLWIHKLAQSNYCSPGEVLNPKTKSCVCHPLGACNYSQSWQESSTTLFLAGTVALVLAIALMFDGWTNSSRRANNKNADDSMTQPGQPLASKVAGSRQRLRRISSVRGQGKRTDCAAGAVCTDTQFSYMQEIMNA